MNLDQWINEVYPYVKNHLDKGVCYDKAILNGIKDYNAILKEMMDGKSKRAKRITDILCKSVYTELRGN